MATDDKATTERWVGVTIGVAGLSLILIALWMAYYRATYELPPLATQPTASPPEQDDLRKTAYLVAVVTMALVIIFLACAWLLSRWRQRFGMVSLGEGRRDRPNASKPAQPGAKPLD